MTQGEGPEGGGLWGDPGGGLRGRGALGVTQGEGSEGGGLWGDPR